MLGSSSFSRGLLKLLDHLCNRYFVGAACLRLQGPAILKPLLKHNNHITIPDEQSVAGCKVSPCLNMILKKSG